MGSVYKTRPRHYTVNHSLDITLNKHNSTFCGVYYASLVAIISV